MITRGPMATFGPIRHRSPILAVESCEIKKQTSIKNQFDDNLSHQ